VKKNKTKSLSEDDVEIWLRTVSGVEKKSVLKESETVALVEQKVKGKRSTPLIKNTYLKEKSIETEPKAALANLLSNRSVDKRVSSKMKAGKIDPEATLDLHGYRLTQAKSALRGFLFRAYESKKRLVLIITGKGKPKAEWDLNLDYRGVLRNEVPVWLEEAPLAGLILSVKKANSKHGGGGALYVYLRKNKLTIN
jgi:DNA-nicking Smr family endonuclease|tara:strand:- start:1055 stop:1642 length:588 start_codon:yes stop_codon:yes gene_type:complete